MFAFTPNSIVSSRLLGPPAKNKVQAGAQHDSSTCNSSANRYSGGWGIIVSSCHEDAASVKTCTSRRQRSVHNDVFISQSQGDVDGYINSARSITESQRNDEFSPITGQRRTDRNVGRRTSDRYYDDVHWAAQSHAMPSRSSGTFSFSESARLCQSCGTRVTNSVSLYGSQESLSCGERQLSADIYSTVCSVFWKMSLTFHPFVASSHNRSSDFVEFSSLWPSSRGLACLLPEICASLQGSIEVLCRIAIFANVIKLLSALIDLRIVGESFLFSLHVQIA